MKSFNEELENALKGDELKNIGIDITEIAIDQVLNDGVLKDIPILNYVIALFKSGTNIRDALFLRKLLIFINKIQEVSNSKREEFFKKISKISNRKKRLFEKILFTIDKIDESEKTLLLGKVFKHLIIGNIDLIQYYRISRVIEDMMLDEINYFFYKHGYYDHNDETRKKYYYYSELIGEQNLIVTMIKNDLYGINDELTYEENIRPQQYKIKKKEGLTSLGKLFCEFGFDSPFYLTKPIE